MWPPRRIPACEDAAALAPRLRPSVARASPSDYRRISVAWPWRRPALLGDLRRHVDPRHFAIDLVRCGSESTRLAVAQHGRVDRSLRTHHRALGHAQGHRALDILIHRRVFHSPRFAQSSRCWCAASGSGRRNGGGSYRREDRYSRTNAELDTPRSLAFTASDADAVGKAVIRQAYRVLEEAARIQELAKPGQDPLVGALCLGMIFTIGRCLLPWLIPKLRKLAPDCRSRSRRTPHHPHRTSVHCFIRELSTPSAWPYRTYRTGIRPSPCCLSTTACSAWCQFAEPLPVWRSALALRKNFARPGAIETRLPMTIEGHTSRRLTAPRRRGIPLAKVARISLTKASRSAGSCFRLFLQPAWSAPAPADT